MSTPDAPARTGTGWFLLVAAVLVALAAVTGQTLADTPDAVRAVYAAGFVAVLAWYAATSGWLRR